MAHRFGHLVAVWSLVRLLYNESYHQLVYLQRERRMSRDRMLRRLLLATGLLLQAIS
jgi:hypothetical protein